MFRLRRFRYKRSRNKFTFLVLVSIVLITLIFLNVRFTNLTVSIAQNKAKYIALQAINNTVNDYLTSSNDTKDLIIVTTDANKNITSLNTDIAKMNTIKSYLSIKISEKLSQEQEISIKVPILNVLGISIFSNVGPKIPVKIIPLSYVKVDFSDKFVSAGINQTKLEIMLNVDANITVLIPLMTSNISVNTSLPVAQTVLLGNVPQNYTNIEGTDRTTPNVGVDIMQK